MIDKETKAYLLNRCLIFDLNVYFIEWLNAKKIEHKILQLGLFFPKHKNELVDKLRYIYNRYMYASLRYQYWQKS